MFFEAPGVGYYKNRFERHVVSCHSRGARINKICILNPTTVVKLLQYSGLGSNTGMGFLCTNDLQ